MIVRNLTIRRNFPVLARIDAGFQLGYSGVGSGPRQGGGLTCGGTFRGSRCLHATDLRRTPLSPGSRCASTPPRTSCLPVSRSAERRAPSCRESPESPQDASGRFPAPGAVRAAVAARIPQKGFRAASCAPPPRKWSFRPLSAVPVRRILHPLQTPLARAGDRQQGHRDFQGHFPYSSIQRN
jgi:hypothetical protein